MIPKMEFSHCDFCFMQFFWLHTLSQVKLASCFFKYSPHIAIIGSRTLHWRISRTGTAKKVELGRIDHCMLDSRIYNPPKISNLQIHETRWWPRWRWLGPPHITMRLTMSSTTSTTISLSSTTTVTSVTTTSFTSSTTATVTITSTTVTSTTVTESLK